MKWYFAITPLNLSACTMLPYGGVLYVTLSCDGGFLRRLLRNIPHSIPDAHVINLTVQI